MNGKERIEKVIYGSIPENYSKIMGALFSLAVYLYDMYYLLVYGRDMLDSDMAAELVLADHLNQTHSILSTDWFYSTEIKIVGLQWFYRIGLLLFPNNWHYARCFGMAIALAILAFGSFLVVNRITNRKDFGFWAAGFSLCPLGFWYFWQTIYGGFYICYAVFSLYTIYLLLKLREVTKKSKSILCWIGLGLIAFFTGLTGIRQIMVFYAPLLLAVFLIRNKKKIFGASFYCFFVSGIGYLINMLVLAKKYDFVTQSEQIWGKGTGSWITTLQWYIYGFGYCQNARMGFYFEPLNVSLFSFNGIAVGFGLLVGFAVVASAIWLMVHYKKLDDTDQFLTAVSLSMIFVIGFTFTYIYGTMQYWQQTMVFGLILIVVAIHNIDVKGKNISYALLLTVSLLLLISGKGTVNGVTNEPLRAMKGYQYAIDWILENTDYQVGVADFWYSDIAVELSNGKLDMCTVYCVDGGASEYIHPWLQAAHHEDTLPDHHYFFIGPHREDMYAWTEMVTKKQAYCIYDDEVYSVFAID